MKFPESFINIKCDEVIADSFTIFPFIVILFEIFVFNPNDYLEVPDSTGKILFAIVLSPNIKITPGSKVNGVSKIIVLTLNLNDDFIL